MLVEEPLTPTTCDDCFTPVSPNDEEYDQDDAAEKLHLNFTNSPTKGGQQPGLRIDFFKANRGDWVAVCGSLLSDEFLFGGPSIKLFVFKGGGRRRHQ